MSIEQDEFRRVLGHFPTGVTVVTTRDPDSGEPIGLTVNAFASLSLEPPLVLACVERSADSHDVIRRAGVFAVNVLDQEAERISRRFATWDAETKFDGLAHREEVTGAPVLDVALAWVDCRVHDAFGAGDHTVFVGAVVAADAHEGTPLLYYRGGYGRLAP